MRHVLAVAVAKRFWRSEREILTQHLDVGLQCCLTCSFLRIRLFRAKRLLQASAADHELRSPMSHATPIVFVVDDDVSMRESLEALIRCAGWQPETFASAQEFLSRPRVLAPSCLVLDVDLPGLNCLDLQKRVAAERMDMPIIFITGYGDVPMTVRAMKAGAVEFLMKPFGDDVLLSAIR